MKHYLLLLFVIVTSLNVLGQSKLPNLTVDVLDGKSMQLSEFVGGEKPVVISFWATWCKPCNNELSEISDQFDDWSDLVDFNFLAVTIDDTRSVSKVKSMVYGKEWPFTIVLDQNQDLKRALNVATIPHVFVFNANGELVYQHKGYTPGSEMEILKALQELEK